MASRSYQAADIPADLAGSGWYDILPDPGPAHVLDASRSTDWLIIGAGFAGLSAARQILKDDSQAEVTVLDAQRIAWGACGRNSGFMIDLPHELQSEDYAADGAHSRREIVQNRAAIAFAGDVVEQFGLQRAFERCGKYHGAVDSAGLAAMKAFSRDLAGMNEPYTELSAGDMKTVTGTEYYTGGIHTPGCVQIQPAEYIRGLAHGLSSEYPNCMIYENSPAQRITPGNPVVVETPAGEVRARRTILTINGHLGSFGWYPRQLMHVFTFASMTRALTGAEVASLGGETAWGLIPAHPMGTTVRRLRQNRIVIRNTFTYNPNMRTRPSQVQKLGKRHDRSFAARFPMLEEVTMEHRWGGHLCLSRNSAPVFGELDDNLYAAGCHNGLGTTKGTLGGKLIADLALGKDSEMLQQLLASPAPQRLPPAAVMTPAAHSYLKWHHWRAGRDL